MTNLKVKKFFYKKNIYLLLLLIISLLGLVISPTYAKFTSNYITPDDIAGISLDFSIGITKVEEYEQLEINPQEYIIFNVEIENVSSNTMYYGIWYKMKIPSEINSNIIIARLEGTETTTSGSLNASTNKTATIIISNKTDSPIIIDIGVASSTTSAEDIEYLKGKKLITGTYNESPNAPNLDSGLIPVYYDSTSNNWKKADSTNANNSWYDYNNKKWANAVIKSSTSIVDLSNNANNGTANNVTWDKTNKTITTSGTSTSYINCGLKSYDFGSDLSFVIRVKFNELTSGSDLDFFGNWQTGGGGIYLDSANNELGFSLYIDGGYKRYYSTYQVTTNTWYTVVGTYNGSNLILYVNGSKATIDSSTSTATTSGSVGAAAVPIAIGGNIGTAGTLTTNLAKVTTSSVLIFDRALTASEISSNYSGVPNPTNKTDLLVYYDFCADADIPVNTVISDTSTGGTLAFYTWIPRFKYQVWNITRQAGDESTYAYPAYTKGINIRWERDTNTTENVSCTYDITTAESATNLSDVCTYNGTDTITTSSDNTNYPDAWYTHPAFTFGSDELTGFWIGKFGTTGTATAPTVLPNTTILRNQTISAQFTTSKVFQTYGLSDDIDAHMLTSLEWGAVSYLTHSIYGLCDGTSCRDIYINNSSSMYTGRSGGAIAGSENLNLTNFYGSSTTTETTQYNATGYYNYKGYKIAYDGTTTTTKDESKVASTTGNVTGVYDISGGAYEYVMGNMVDSSNEFYPSSSETSWNGSTTLENKYYNSYSYSETNTTEQIAYNRARLGDATAEVLGGTNGTSSWKPGSGITGTASYFVYGSSSWMARGGNYSLTYSGSFCFSRNNGASSGISFRSASAEITELVVESHFALL